MKTEPVASSSASYAASNVQRQQHLAMVAGALSVPEDLGPIVLAAEALGTFVSALDQAR